MILSDIRNYEVSIWTLQDGFISVLKYATLENKGLIQEPELKIVDDGTLEFTFKIPMYIVQDGLMILNPIWYNTTNGVLMASTRKIKVIVNKKDAVRNVSSLRATLDEKVFLFIVTKVVLTHLDNILTCEVTCLGLAFHELGKIGYKFSLSQLEFLNEYSEWANATDELRLLKKLEEPHATIQYWNDKIFNNLKYWTYLINMNWDGYLFKNEDGTTTSRETFKVYLDTYASSWDKETGRPNKIEMAKEKLRLINSSESNVYNLTQTIALAFGVHCKYIYLHDNNYNIISKKVVYYNNFLNLTYGALDLTYPYNTSSISREMDSTNLVTKMYIKPANSDTSRDGFITVLSTPANRSGEDYLLNFDYMHTVGSITDEQYNLVFLFLKRVAKINEKLEPLGELIIKLNQTRINVLANSMTYDRGRKLALLRYTLANALVNSLTNDTGILHITAEKPDNGVLLFDNNKNNYFLKISQTGIIPLTFHIYRKYSYSATGKDRVSDEIFGNFLFDLFNNLVNVTDIYIDGTLGSRSVYLTYDYLPLEYAKRVKKIWERKMKNDETLYNKALTKLTKIDESLENLNLLYNELLLQKRLQIKSFLTLMGPALRLGYWLPDQYNDYGDKLQAIFENGFAIGTKKVIPNTNPELYEEDTEGNFEYEYNSNYLDLNGYATPIWDEIPFEGLQLPYYESGINRLKVYYPCIKLTSEQLLYIQRNNNVSLIFYDLKYNQTSKNYRSFAIGSECQLGLLKDNNDNVFPVLIVVGAKDMTKLQIKNMQSSDRNTGIYLKIISSEKEIAYKPTESTIKFNNLLSEKTVKQLIITTNEESEKICEKTIIKKYLIITKLPLESLQLPVVTPPPTPQEISIRTNLINRWNIGKRSTTVKTNTSTASIALGGLTNANLSFEIMVKEGDWAEGHLAIKIQNGATLYDSYYSFRSGVNRVNCKNISLNSNSRIVFLIRFNEDHYSLYINKIDAIVTGIGVNAQTNLYQLTPTPTREPVIIERLKLVSIQEKNLFHNNAFTFMFIPIYANEDDTSTNSVTVLFNDADITANIDNHNQYTLNLPFLLDNSYSIEEVYTIDKTNKNYLLSTRSITKNLETIYSEEFKNGTNGGNDYIEITDETLPIINNEYSSIKKHTIKTITEKTLDELAVRLFNITTDKYSTFVTAVETGACLGIFLYDLQTHTTNIKNGKKNIAASYTRSYVINSTNYDINDLYSLNQNSAWLLGPAFDINTQTQLDWDYIPVYPRILINSLKLKLSDVHLSLLYNDCVLTKYLDYTLLTRNNKYYVTFKIDKLLLIGKYKSLDSNSSSGDNDNNESNDSNNDSNDSNDSNLQAQSDAFDRRIIIDNNNLIIPIIKLFYCLSNADTAIYLDAIQVLKENAFPKVSYLIDVNMVNPDFIRTIYNKMGYITHINDNLLKFENVLGYISEITMHLDKPWEDLIVIKNYKTDFENLFSTIVASTLAMKKNAYTIGLAAGAFDSTGNLSIEAIEQALALRGLMFNFNNGKLAINLRDGILGTSESGIVNFRCNGIFTSSKKDENGEWIWNTAITPTGINADLITTGQLDTNLIRIFAGDRLRFQLNNLGLFGYKSFLEDFGGTTGIHRFKKIQEKWQYLVDELEYTDSFETYLASLNDQDSYTALLYVKFNENGLFLTAEKNAIVYSNNDYVSLDKAVTRVLISWDGLKLRNWSNDEVFWADPDTGNLYITGTVFADSFKILNNKADLNDENATPMSLNLYMTIKFEDHVKTSQNLEYIFNAAGDILKRAWSSLATLNGEIVLNAEVLNGFLQKAKLLPHEPILLVTGEESTVSALVLHPTQGIWMGSTNKITFYSGQTNPKLVRNDNTGKYEETLDGAAVTIDKNQILLGVSNISGASSDSGAVLIASDKIVLAVGGTIGTFNDEHQHPTLTYTSAINYNTLKNNSSISGIVITKLSIGLATQTGNQRDLILMDQNGILVGVSSSVITNINSHPFDDFTNTYTGLYLDYQLDGEKTYLKDTIVKFNNKFYKSLITNKGILPGSDNNVWLLIATTATTSITKRLGSFVKINNLGIIIGSNSNIYINTSNVLLLTIKNNSNNYTVFGLGSGITDWNDIKFFKLSSSTYTIENSTGSQNWGMFFDGANLHIKGYLYAQNTTVMTESGTGVAATVTGTPFPDYLQGKIDSTLEEVFETAGDILILAMSTLYDVNNRITTNQVILNSFLTKVLNLQPKRTTDTTPPENFKPGDIWLPNNGNKYVAMFYSSEKPSSGAGALWGWNKTYDGSLASITGTGLNIDAVLGTIDLYAGSKITLRAKSLLLLASGDIQITGNHSINIGSKWVNIGSTNGGINIVSTNIDNNTTIYDDNNCKYNQASMPTSGYEEGELWKNTQNNKVYRANKDYVTGATPIEDWTLINTNLSSINKVQISREGIIMHGSKILLMAASSNSEVSALLMDPANNKGLWLGSNQSICFFSSDLYGSISNNINNAILQITPTNIILGVKANNNFSDSAVLIKSDSIILAVGAKVSDFEGITSIPAMDNAITGVKITKGGVWIANGSGSNRALVAITPGNIKLGISGVNNDNNNGSFVLIAQSGITLGSNSDITLGTYNGNGSGSFIKIANSGIQIGSSSNLIVNTNNIILDTSFASSSEYSRTATYNTGDIVWSGEYFLYLCQNNNVSGITPGTQGDNNWKYLKYYSSSNTPIIFQLGNSLTYNIKKLLTIKGDIIANSFQLSGTEITTTDQNGNLQTYNLATISSNASSSAIAGTVTTYAYQDYGTNGYGVQPSSITGETRPNTVAGRIIWIKTVTTYQNGQSNTEIRSERAPIDGKTLTSVTPLYYLKTSSPNTAPDAPPPFVTTNIVNTWTTTVPTYTSGKYYTCYQYTWSDNTTTYSSVVQNYGLTTANANATSAYTKALDTATSISPITINGLAGDVVWNGTTYGVALGNNDNSKPMLIGSNSGLTIIGHYNGHIVDNNGIEYEIEINNNQKQYYRIINNSKTYYTIDAQKIVNDQGSLVATVSSYNYDVNPPKVFATNGTNYIIGQDNNGNTIYYQLDENDNRIYYTITLAKIRDSNSQEVGVVAHTYAQNPAIVMDKSGIALNGSSLNFTAANGDSALILNSDGINMAALGTVNIQGNEGFIQFGTDTVENGLITTTCNFRVDKDGTVYCKKLICDELQSSSTSTPTDTTPTSSGSTYSLGYFTSQYIQHRNYQQHNWNVDFSTKNNTMIAVGSNYQIQFNFKFRVTDNALNGLTADVTIAGKTLTKQLGTKSGGSIFDLQGTMNGGTISQQTSSIPVSITFSYNWNSERDGSLYGTAWATNVTHTITLIDMP